MRFSAAGACVCGHGRFDHGPTGCSAPVKDWQRGGCWCPEYHSVADVERQQEEMDHYASRVALLN